MIGFGEQETDIDGVTATPVPLRLTSWLVDIPLSVRVKMPVRAPGAVGVKTTGIVQVAPTASVELAVPQVFPAAALKSPVKLGLALNWTAETPRFSSVTGDGEESLATETEPKLRTPEGPISRITELV